MYPSGTSEYGITNRYMAAEVYGDGGHKVRIPSNLSIIGTMNTSAIGEHKVPNDILQIIKPDRIKQILRIKFKGIIPLEIYGFGEKPAGSVPCYFRR